MSDELYFGEDAINSAIKEMEDSRDLYEILHDKIISMITRDRDLKLLVHSFKARFKDVGHLREKVIRKNQADIALPEGQRLGPINAENIKERVTDFCGVRILHLYQGQFENIHRVITDYINRGELALYEKPKAYTWDPEYSKYFQDLGLDSILRSTLYTSVHYVVKAREDSDITCEIQVRTLFEEVWGEIDHTLNYPIPTEIIAVQEQLKVLSRVVGAGTRLADSIFRLSSK